LAEDFSGGVAKGRLGAIVEQNNALLVIDADDGIGGQRHDSGVSLVGMAERIAGTCHWKSSLSPLPAWTQTLSKQLASRDAPSLTKPASARRQG
jgi:hypothetical protein